MFNVNNANRDVFVGEIANDLLNEKDITLFGFAYLENGNIHYHFTMNEINASLLQLAKIAEKIICTPIETITEKSLPIKLKNQISLHLRNILQQKYPADYFAFLTYFNEVKSNNSAAPILKEHLRDFRNERNNSLLQANYNLVNSAYYAKHLHEPSYLELLQKIYYSKSAALQTINRVDFRNLGGMGYFLPDKTIAYYSNAYLPNILKKRFLLETDNYLVSPILLKSFDLSSLNNPSIKDMKEDFMNTLKQMINLNYMLRVQELKLLPPTIDQMSFRKRLNQIKPNLTDYALRAINFYAKMWGAN